MRMPEWLGDLAMAVLAVVLVMGLVYWSVVIPLDTEATRESQQRADLCAFLLAGGTRADSMNAYTDWRCTPPSAVEEP